MCRAVTCKQCGKTTWAGCGQHIDAVKRDLRRLEQLGRPVVAAINGTALGGGLILIILLIGFTVMQHAFAGGITQGPVTDIERRALALTGAGDMVWDWDVSADKVFTSPETESLLGLRRGTLEGPAAKWLDVLHPLDQLAGTTPVEGGTIVVPPVDTISLPSGASEMGIILKSAIASGMPGRPGPVPRSARDAMPSRCACIASESSRCLTSISRGSRIAVRL